MRPTARRCPSAPLASPRSTRTSSSRDRARRPRTCSGWSVRSRTASRNGPAFDWNRRCISLVTSISRPAELPTRRPVAALRSRTAAIAIGLVVLLAAGLVVSRSSVFRVRRIEVTGVDRLRRADVIRWSGLSHATNALWLDQEDVAARLQQQDPWIAPAVVTTSFPATVHIAVLERSPIAETRTPGGAMLVAEDGTLLGPADGSDRTLPAIVVPAVTDGKQRVPLEGPARAVSALVDAELSGVRA